MNNKYGPRRSMREAFPSLEKLEAPTEDEVLMNFRIDRELHKELKTYAFVHDVSMKEILTGLVEKFLDKQRVEQRKLPGM